jgi:hypothetical protein
MKAASNSQPRVGTLGRNGRAWQEKDMKPIAFASIALALAACGQPSESAPANQVAETKPAPKPAAPAPKAFVFDEKNDLVDFHFGWSAEAAAVPELVSRFQAEMEKAKDELVAGAKEDKAFRDMDGLEFHGYQSSTDYQTVGQSSGLLSLFVEASAYTGGAHPNHGTNALLWDRSSAREIKVSDLFADPANRDRLLTQRWCNALNKQREEKRGAPVTGNDMFDECPKLDEIAIVPTDKDGNGHFERLILTASPYVAGPYVEGSYEIDLGVTVDVISALKSEYRASFEAAQPQ